ncbi:flavin reductase family protein [Streptomyces sp. NPDC048442]|uniref:flavin reductase family protein n=1 Tax=Streptomyces sp. NPDC048442 TaxID=3154823 RepID=UPI00343CC2F9
MTVPAQRRTAVGAQDYREAMSLLAVPVCVVTTRQDGENWGFTASTVTGISLDPPLVSVSVARSSSCHSALTLAPEFVINVLGDHQRHLATRFSTRDIDRFADEGISTLPGTELPVVTDASAVYRCTRQDVVPVGDHDLFIGELTDVRLRTEAALPLTWYRRAFHRPDPYAGPRPRAAAAVQPSPQQRWTQ